MKINTRDGLVDVTEGATTARVMIGVGGTIVTAAATDAAGNALKLAAGKEAYGG